MHVIYSAGTTSPSCSPIPRRKIPSPLISPTTPNREWRPIAPGYQPPSSHSVVIHRTVEVQHHQHILVENDSSLKDTIPAMPKAIAIGCLVCNILFPGLGK